MENETRQKDALFSADTRSSITKFFLPKILGVQENFAVGGKAHSNTVHDLCQAQITFIFAYGSLL